MIDSATLITIAGMAIVTYLTRIAGVLLMARVPLSPLVARWLRQLPAAVIAAIIVPDLVAGGATTLLAGLATVLVAFRSRNILLAMLTGVLVAYSLRRLL